MRHFLHSHKYPWLTMVQRSIPGIKIRFAGDGRLPFFGTGTIGGGLGAERKVGQKRCLPFTLEQLTRNTISCGAFIKSHWLLCDGLNEIDSRSMC